jgi:hypothetical protein
MAFLVATGFDKLAKLLLAADEVISFNGLQFNELVLRKHCKLKGKLPSKGLHVDLCHEGMSYDRKLIDITSALADAERLPTRAFIYV